MVQIWHDSDVVWSSVVYEVPVGVFVGCLSYNAEMGYEWCSLVGTGRVLTLPSAEGTQFSKFEHTESMM